jgi:succinoglycan biosynthesis transport protein ExoP
MQIFLGDEMKDLLTQLRKTYTYIIVDLSPLSPVVDVRATTEIIDFYFYIIEWGNTRVDVISEALRGAPDVYENIVGFVLNKVDVDVIGRYCTYQTRYDRHAYLVKSKEMGLKRYYYSKN